MLEWVLPCFAASSPPVSGRCEPSYLLPSYLPPSYLLLSWHCDAFWLPSGPSLIKWDDGTQDADVTILAPSVRLRGSAFKFRQGADNWRFGRACQAALGNAKPKSEPL